MPLPRALASLFGPRPLLRLALRNSHDGRTNRHVAQCVFRHTGQHSAVPWPCSVWSTGTRHGPPWRTDPATAQSLLHHHPLAAQPTQVLGVPAFEVNGRLFWPIDSVPVLREAWDHHPAFCDGAWENAKAISSGLP